LNTTAARIGVWLFAIFGAALFASLFLEWYGLEVRGGTLPVALRGPGPSAWEAFGLIDVFLALSALLAVSLVPLGHRVFARAEREGDDVSDSAAVGQLGLVGLMWLVWMAFFVCAALIVYRMIEPPLQGDLGGVEVDVVVKAGPFIALACVGLPAIGLLLLPTPMADPADKAVPAPPTIPPPDERATAPAIWLLAPSRTEPVGAHRG
jgi:hypothetical protein